MDRDKIRVGKKAGNTHISQDGGKYWEIGLILNLQIYSPTKVKHHLTCFNNIFSNNELISNRFAVFVTCTHKLTYL
jgi:hypothetical protein